MILFKVSLFKQEKVFEPKVLILYRGEVFTTLRRELGKDVFVKIGEYFDDTIGSGFPMLFKGKIRLDKKNKEYFFSIAVEGDYFNIYEIIGDEIFYVMSLYRWDGQPDDITTCRNHQELIKELRKVKEEEVESANNV